MKAVIQRVTSAWVLVDTEEIARIRRGLLVLLGVAKGDRADDVRELVEKVCSLRMFADDNGKMNLSVLDTAGDILLVSQFTLLADTSQGRRPSFHEAAPPTHALLLYEQAIEEFRRCGLTVASGRFGAHMQVSLVNDGPVTFILESSSLTRREATRYQADL